MLDSSIILMDSSTNAAPAAYRELRLLSTQPELDDHHRRARPADGRAARAAVAGSVGGHRLPARDDAGAAGVSLGGDAGGLACALRRLPARVHADVGAVRVRDVRRRAHRV